jgi:hypothetical protein
MRTGLLQNQQSEIHNPATTEEPKASGAFSRGIRVNLQSAWAEGEFKRSSADQTDFTDSERVNLRKSA